MTNQNRRRNEVNLGCRKTARSSMKKLEHNTSIGMQVTAFQTGRHPSGTEVASSHPSGLINHGILKQWFRTSR